MAVLAISSGTHTYLFVLEQPETLPIALQLLLTHNDYTKVGCAVFSGVLGKVWRDFGVELTPLHDVEDVMSTEFATSELYVAFTMMFPGARFPYDRSMRYSNWAKEELSSEQLEYAAFAAWASRTVWLHLAQPQGYPPVCRSTPLDTAALCGEVTCKYCQARLHGPDAMKVSAGR